MKLDPREYTWIWRNKAKNFKEPEFTPGEILLHWSFGHSSIYNQNKKVLNRTFNFNNHRISIPSFSLFETVLKSSSKVFLRGKNCHRKNRKLDCWHYQWSWNIKWKYRNIKNWRSLNRFGDKIILQKYSRVIVSYPLHR